MTDIVVLDRLYPAYDSDWYRLLGSTEAPASSRKRLSPSQAILDACGTSDDVTNSVHYGHLAKAVSSLVGEEARSGVHYIGVHALIEDITRAAFELAGESAKSLTFRSRSCLRQGSPSKLRRQR